MITKFNHLTLMSGNNRISDITEVKSSDVWKIIEKYYKMKKGILFDGEPFEFDITNDKQFYLISKGYRVIKCDLYMQDEFICDQLKIKYGIKNNFPVLSIDINCNSKEELKALMLVQEWAGDFERCFGHILLSKLENNKKN